MNDVVKTRVKRVAKSKPAIYTEEYVNNLSAWFSRDYSELQSTNGILVYFLVVSVALNVATIALMIAGGF
jgi:hypothetical protein